MCVSSISTLLCPSFWYPLRLSQTLVVLLYLFLLLARSLDEIRVLAILFYIAHYPYVRFHPGIPAVSPLSPGLPPSLSPPTLSLPFALSHFASDSLSLPPSIYLPLPLSHLYHSQSLSPHLLPLFFVLFLALPLVLYLSLPRYIILYSLPSLLFRAQSSFTIRNTRQSFAEL